MPLPILITVDPQNLNIPLRQVFVGQGSALKLQLAGFDAEQFTAAVFIHALTEGADPARFDAVLNDDDVYEVKISGWSLNVPGNTEYEVTIFDSDDANQVYWSGRGKLTIRRAITSAPLPQPPEVTPPSSYIQHPTTGLWHKVVGSLNELGQLSLEVSPEGVEHV
jgi:hypothetical protein